VDISRAMIISDALWVGYYAHGSITYQDLLNMPMDTYMDDFVEKYNLFTDKIVNG